MELYYKEPASQWEETIPIGNGSLGAMIFGTVKKERLGLNEDTLWSGYKRDKNREAAYGYLEEARALVLQEQYVAAEALIREHMLGEYGESYLPLGDLEFLFGHGDLVEKYERRLDITTATATVSYEAEGHTYKREYFASYPSQSIVMKFTCDAPIMSWDAMFSSQLQHNVLYTKEGILIEGQCPEHVDPNYVSNEQPIIQGTKGRFFQASLQILSTDGTVLRKEDCVSVMKASYIVVAFDAVKSKKMKESSTYETLRDLHQKDYRSIYEKVELYLGEQSTCPTKERLEALRQGKEDPSLFALYYQYGRYLLISSSRKGSQPANLQGIWSWQMRAPWSSNWTTNINTQMNYWIAHSGNLSECMEPYLNLVERLCEEGKKTAKIHYNCRGFVHHHNADYWCNTNPMGIGFGQESGEGDCATWSFWPMGGVWLVAEVFRFYEYYPDVELLRNRLYPLLREAVLFCLDWLVEVDGEYVTCPSTSPENRFMTKEGVTSCIGMSSAMDLTLIYELFSNFVKSCNILGIEDILLKEIQEKSKKMASVQIGSRGQILEWHKEFEEAEAGHRHLSHLYGLFPGELFDTKELKHGARISLEERLAAGSGHTGWSCAWIINLYAMFGEGEKAYDYVVSLLKGATHSNLWGDHPPFQIDANFGGAAGIANMLVQERNGELTLLPALPKAWKDGYVRGLTIKGGKTVDIMWRGGHMVGYKVI